ncbi:MAG: hypothetical protein ACXWJZ_04575 [Burkholderiaceae bacterium]
MVESTNSRPTTSSIFTMPEQNISSSAGSSSLLTLLISNFTRQEHFHSRQGLATFQRSLSLTSQEIDRESDQVLENCINRLKKNEQALINQVCMLTPLYAREALCGVPNEIAFRSNTYAKNYGQESLAAEFEKSHERDQATLYLINLDSINHAIAIVRVGNRAMLLQSWMGEYSLGDWLTGTSGLGSNAWSPTKGSRNITEFSENLGQMRELWKNNKYDKASDEIQAMFGSPESTSNLISSEELEYISIILSDPFKIKWSDSKIVNGSGIFKQTA